MNSVFVASKCVAIFTTSDLNGLLTMSVRFDGVAATDDDSRRSQVKHLPDGAGVVGLGVIKYNIGNIGRVSDPLQLIEIRVAELLLGRLNHSLVSGIDEIGIICGAVISMHHDINCLSRIKTPIHFTSGSDPVYCYLLSYHQT